MKPITILLSFLLTTTFSHAQNLVPNYSFEQDDSCPTNLNGNYYEYSLGCVSWGEVAGTSDYYNACDTAAASINRPCPVVGVPLNSLGFQAAYDGIAYAGIATYDSQVTSYREYIIDSIPALEIDTPYLVSIEVSLADSSRFATDGLGVLFTTYGKPYVPPFATISETPQIDYTSYGVISDTMHWTKLSGIFIPDSAYTSLTIGGFRDETHMTVVPFNNFPKKNTPPSSYYYIDWIFRVK